MKTCNLLILVLFCSLNSQAFVVTERSQIKGNESDITEINLSNTGLSTFPEEILDCKNLIKLDLSDNGIIGLPIELAELKKLKVLDFSRNQGLSYANLGDVFKEAVFELRELDLSGCELGFIPQQIGRLKSLKKLNVAGNFLNNLPYGVIQLTNLEDVVASDNQISDLSFQVYKWWNLKSLDVSNNPNLNTDQLIFSLSACDGLDKLVMSHLKSIPPAFKNLKVDDLEIRNSTISTFPRIEISVPIKRLSFVRCSFIRASKLAEIIDESVRPEFLRLNEVQSDNLSSFLRVSADSIDIQNNDLSNIDPLVGVRSLKWVDARGNNINERSIEKVKNARPDIDLMLSEPVAPNIGIKPPLPGFEKKPTYRNISADQANTVNVGRASFEIPNNAFLDQDGNIYTGDVQLAYTEYFTPTEIFLSGITMTSEEDGENQVFSSAGMFNLTATDDQGNQLELNSETPINVDLMSSSASPDMNVYFLNDDGVWEYRGKDTIAEPFQIDMALVDSAANNALFNYQQRNIVVSENRFVPTVKGDGDTRSFIIKFNELGTNSPVAIDVTAESAIVNRPGNVASFISKTEFVYDGHRDSANYYRDWLRKAQRTSVKSYNKFKRGSKRAITQNYEWGLSYISNMNLSIDNNSDRVKLNFMFKDSAVSIPVVLKSDPANPRIRVKLFERYFKTYDREKRKDELARLRRNRQLRKLIQKEEMEIRNLARQREVSRQRIYYENGDYLKQVADVSSVGRSFGINGFGVWNCDQRGRMLMPTPLPRQFVGEDGSSIELSDSVTHVYVIDFEKNGVFTFGDRDQAFFDKGGAKTAIIVFLSAVTVGIYKSWKKIRQGSNLDERQMTIRQLNTENMNVGSLVEFIEE